jgi:hypothetical protein
MVFGVLPSSCLVTKPFFFWHVTNERSQQEGLALTINLPTLELLILIEKKVDLIVILTLLKHILTKKTFKISLSVSFIVLSNHNISSKIYLLIAHSG